MKTTRNLQILLVLTSMVFTIVGCGEALPPGMPKPVPCDIIVTQEGKPLAGAVVKLHSDGAQSEWTAVGRTDASGTATIYTLDKYKGAVPGKYKVSVIKTEMEGAGVPLSTEEAEGRDTSLSSFYLVEEQYRNAATTTLEIEVAAGTPTHTLDAGKAVRIKIEDRR